MQSFEQLRPIVDACLLNRPFEFEKQQAQLAMGVQKMLKEQ